MYMCVYTHVKFTNVIPFFSALVQVHTPHGSSAATNTARLKYTKWKDDPKYNAELFGRKCQQGLSFL